MNKPQPLNNTLAYLDGAWKPLTECVLPINTHALQYGTGCFEGIRAYWNGTTTTFEALWQGVPVVTLEGGHHAARVGASILTHAGLGFLVTKTVDEYVATAVRVGQDEAERVRQRALQRQRLLDSGLLNPAAFGQRWGAVVRRCWQRWCASGKVAS